MRDHPLGFSLIELVVIIVILGIISLIAFAKAQNMLQARSLLAAHEISANLRYIRNVTLDTERTTRVTFEPRSSTYTVDIKALPGHLSSLDGFTALKNPIDQTDWVISIPERFAGVRLLTVDIAGDNTLFFEGSNAIPSGTSGALTNKGSLYFNTGLIIEITPQTGYILTTTES